MPLSIDPSRPIYLQIMEEIKKRAVRGDYPPGGQLPSVRDLARETGVNPNTIARVYLELERGGFTSTRRGQGTFLTDDTDMLDRERTRLGREATRRFVSAISELGLTDEQRRDIAAFVDLSLGGKNDTDTSSRED